VSPSTATQKKKTPKFRQLRGIKRKWPSPRNNWINSSIASRWVRKTLYPLPCSIRWIAKPRSLSPIGKHFRREYDTRPPITTTRPIVYLVDRCQELRHHVGRCCRCHSKRVCAETTGLPDLLGRYSQTPKTQPHPRDFSFRKNEHFLLKLTPQTRNLVSWTSSTGFSA
jgi:hypothetical protein